MSGYVGNLSILGICLLVNSSGFAGDKKPDPVPYEVYGKGYFVKNNAALPSNPAYLLLADQAGFEKIFGIGFVMGPRPKLVEDKLFDKHLIAVVIKSGNTLWKYEMEQVRIDQKRLVVQYRAAGKESPTTKYHSPLIVAVPRGDYDAIVFIENGKEVGRQTVKK